jgi:hypothetical protein
VQKTNDSIPDADTIWEYTRPKVLAEKTFGLVTTRPPPRKKRGNRQTKTSPQFNEAVGLWAIDDLFETNFGVYEKNFSGFALAGNRLSEEP